ncbi:kinase-like domain-containing protein [Nemania sp. FL0916]|nr:kinase-like domain-containing protein [Nemania sp. FL0916]
MSPHVNTWEELLWADEEFDEDTGDFLYTMVVAVEDDMLYFSLLEKRKTDLAFQEITESLTRIADEEIFPRWSQDLALTKPPEEISPNVFIKRPRVALYDIFSKHKQAHLLAKGLAEEAEAMEILRNHPHPNIVGYHGCHVRRGYITGLVLDRHPHDLNKHLQSGQTIHDKRLFIESLTAAIDHLHSLGWAHNDLNPSNVLVAEDMRPILIDFGSSRRIGDKLSTSRGTKGWIECEMKDYTTSETQHDLWALAKLATWIDNPTFEE